MSPFDIETQDIGEYARQVLARRGIDPDTPPGGEYTLADHLTVNTNLKLDMITPALFRNATTTDPRVDAWIRQYLDDSHATPSLFLRGPVGAGKTRNAFAALHAVTREAARLGRRMTFAKTSHADFNQAMRPTPDGAHRDALADFQTVDLLVFDDLGAGQVTDWAEDTLHRLVDVRWSEARPMIVTTNLRAKDMPDNVDERILSRLAASTQVPLTGRDHRRLA